ncbi:MAG: hypothetical protein ACFCVE_10375 [Phycisphaerae bacterium]
MSTQPKVTTKNQGPGYRADAPTHADRRSGSMWVAVVALVILTLGIIFLLWVF